MGTNSNFLAIGLFEELQIHLLGLALVKCSLLHVSLGQQRRVSQCHGLSGTTTRNVPQNRARATMSGGAVGLRNVARGASETSINSMSRRGLRFVPT